MRSASLALDLKGARLDAQQRRGGETEKERQNVEASELHANIWDFGLPGQAPLAIREGIAHKPRTHIASHRFLGAAWRSNMDETPLSPGEQRTHERKGLRVHRLIRATLERDGESREKYLYVVDISEGGIRLNADDAFELDRPLRLCFTLQYIEFDVMVRPIWQKSLAGGTWTCGFAYHEPTPEQQAQIAQMVESFTVHGRRERFRLKALVSVALCPEGEEGWFNILLVDISPKGLRGLHDEALDKERLYSVRVILPDMSEAEASARAVWQEEVGPTRHEFGMQFVAIEESYAQRIQSFIDRSVGVA